MTSEGKTLFHVVDLMPGSQLHHQTQLWNILIAILVNSILSFNRNIGQNLNKRTERSRAILKFFTGSTSSDLVHYVILRHRKDGTNNWLYISVSMTCYTERVLKIPFQNCRETLLMYVRSSRSSRPEVFSGEGVLKICSKFTGEHPYRSAISVKLQRFANIWKRDSNTGVF